MKKLGKIIIRLINALLKPLCKIITSVFYGIGIISFIGSVLSIKDFIVKKTSNCLTDSLAFVGYGILFLVLGALMRYFGVGHFYKCKKCKKRFCIEEVGSEIIDERNISIKTEVNNYNTNKEIIGSSETYIPGVRRTYKIKYVCKNCGDITYKYETKDIKNI